MKNIVKVLYILIPLIILTILLLLVPNKFNSYYIKNTEYYKTDNIKMIEITKFSENKDSHVTIEDKKTIDKIMNMLGNIKVSKESNVDKKTNSIFYTIYYNDDTSYVYSFEGNNIIIDTLYYKTEGEHELEEIEYN